jgi:hypothetical protein
MEGGKEALEETAREIVALYGADAPELLLGRAAFADEHGDKGQAKARQEMAALAAHVPRNL